MKIYPILTPTEDDALATYGKTAKICYQLATEYQNPEMTTEMKEKYIKLAKELNACAHHSPAEFAEYYIFVSDASKWILMLMTTVDLPYKAMARSRRYRGAGETDYSGIDYDFCDKWSEIFDWMIKKYYPTMSDRDRETCTNQNARGFVDLFAPSYSFEYGIDLRNLCYYINWLEDFAKADSSGLFMHAAQIQAAQLAEQLKEVCTLFDLIKDTKDGSLDIFINDIPPVWFGRSFEYNFELSWDAAAHVVRHRKDTRYWINFDENRRSYYVVPLLEKFPQQLAEYLHDMEQLSEHGMFPGASLLTLSATGNYESVMWALLERAECGSVLLETQRAYQKFWTAYHDSIDIAHYPKAFMRLDKFYKQPKGCTGLFACEKPCFWGCGGYNNRLI